MIDAAGVRDIVDQDRLTVAARIEAVFSDARPPDLYELARDYPSRPGKGLRTTVCLASCRAFGGRTEDAADVAAAIELLHNAFLILDDIQDDSQLRRGAPTLHVRHGSRKAVSAAGALISLAMERVVAAGRAFPDLAVSLFAEFAHLFRRTQEGQWTDLVWADQKRDDITEADYLAMVQDKTCWYSTIHPLRLGALIGSSGAVNLDRLVCFGFYLGAIFQIMDDRDNLIAEAGGYQKDLGADVAEGKRTLPVIHLIGTASPTDRDRVLAALGTRGQYGSTESFQVVRQLMVRHGSIDRAERFADAIVGLALAEAPNAFVEARRASDVDLLVNLVPFVRGILPS
jgi:geranylgeranyl diphosphate synthase type II